MEGPSLIIACEEFERFAGKKASLVQGTASVPLPKLRRSRFLGARSWGKHFLLLFDKITLRIHFLMFGSYRINDAREGRTPKLLLRFGTDTLYFYSCAIKEIDGDLDAQYDWSTDVMSRKWDARKALRQIRLHPQARACDLLMDQGIFSGVGNIIKNEVLFKLKINPETQIAKLTPLQQKKLVAEARAYSMQFYRWKKKNELKRNWKVFRKKVCPVCEGPITKKPTGKGARISHFCRRCQLN